MFSVWEGGGVLFLPITSKWWIHQSINLSICQFDWYLASFPVIIIIYDNNRNVWVIVTHCLHWLALIVHYIILIHTVAATLYFTSLSPTLNRSALSVHIHWIQMMYSTRNNQFINERFIHTQIYSIFTKFNIFFKTKWIIHETSEKIINE